jgi:RNA polymerase sigma-70 factor (ECF subfamily)
LGANSTELTDEQLVQMILRGEDLYEALYSRHYRKVFRFVYAMTMDHAAAEELSQDIFAKAFQNLGTFRGESSFVTWLHRIAMNCCLNSFRRRRLAADYIDDIEENRFPDLRVVSADELVRQGEIQYHLRRALASLPFPDRELIVLKEIAGLSYEELAEHFQCSKGTVGSKLTRLRRLLFEKLKFLKGQV